MDKRLKLDEKHLKEVTGLLNWRLKNTNIKVYAFGSRVHGKPSLTSDIDLALDDNGKQLDPLWVEELRSYFEVLRIPQHVDIIDLNSVSDNFRNIIEKDLLEINYEE